MTERHKASFIITEKNSRQDSIASIHDEIVEELLKLSPMVTKSPTVLIAKNVRKRNEHVNAVEYTAYVDNDVDTLAVKVLSLKYAERVGMNQAIFSLSNGETNIGGRD